MLKRSFTNVKLWKSRTGGVAQYSPGKVLSSSLNTRETLGNNLDAPLNYPDSLLFPEAKVRMDFQPTSQLNLPSAGVEAAGS